MTSVGRTLPSRPRILVDSGDYQCSNLGDVSMLQVTIARLRESWPDASIEVITQDPEALAFHCPGTKPVPWEGRALWLSRGTLLGRLDRVVRPLTPRSSASLEGVLRRHRPALLASLIRGKLRLRGNGAGDLETFLDALNGADMVVLAGAGGFTDHAAAWATPVLEMLALSALRGVPTAIFSHGLGPLHDPELRRIVKDVLPRIGVVALREGLGALPLLDSLGIARDGIMITGDDAIELAYEARTGSAGTGIGVNIRVARSADVDQSYIGLLRPVLHGFAKGHDAPLIPLPIGHGRSTDDAKAAGALIAGYADGGDRLELLDTPSSVAMEAGRCRLVVSGAYHAAVFALSQGIPVICLAKSEYFVGKFLGLASQFGAGCTIVDLGRSDYRERLAEALREGWETAGQLRQPLLEAAARQIAESRRAYGRLAALAGGSAPVAAPPRARAAQASVQTSHLRTGDGA